MFAQVFSRPSAAALTHLLTQNGWALQQLARFAGKTARFDIAPNFSRAAAEYRTGGRPLLAKPQQVSAFMRQVDTLRDDVARLEQRIKQNTSPHPKN